jgi:DNA binding protein with HTH domain/WYL domain-containing protein
MTSSVVIERYLWRVRASRLVGLLGLLQARGRMTAGQLAAELEVSPRTVLRDIEALGAAGIPVYAVRGSQGGFELLAGFRSDLPAAAAGPARRPAVGGASGPGPGGANVQRARVRLSPRGRRLAALLGRPPGVRVRRSPHVVAGREDWVEAWVRIEPEIGLLDMLALGAEVEVLHPPQLRAAVREAATRIAVLHAGAPGPAVPGVASPPG